LSDEKLLPFHSALISVAYQTGQRETIAEWERLLREEADYWSQAAESGKPIPVDEAPQRHHFHRLSQVIWALHSLGYRDSKGLVAGLRTQWEESPALAKLGSENGKHRSPILTAIDDMLPKTQ
jgi:hypothetical protein